MAINNAFLDKILQLNKVKVSELPLPAIRKKENVMPPKANTLPTQPIKSMAKPTEMTPTGKKELVKRTPKEKPDPYEEVKKFIATEPTKKDVRNYFAMKVLRVIENL